MRQLSKFFLKSNKSVNMCGRGVFVFLVLLCCFQTGLCLECYTCSSQIQPNEYNDCESFQYAPWEHRKISPCPYPDSVCAKYVVDYGAFRWVHRSCKHHDVCSYLSATYSTDMNLLLECETCANKNLCNSAPNRMSEFVTLLLLLLCGIFLIYL